MITREEIGANVRAVRRKKGWNQKELAKKVRPKPLTKDTISRIERGATNFTIGTLIAIAQALEANLSDFCPDNGRKESYNKSPELQIFQEGLEKAIREIIEKYKGKRKGSELEASD